LPDPFNPLDHVDPAAYRIDDVESVRTPALAIYTEIVDANIEVTLDLLGGAPDRFRPHVKTSKLAATMNRLIERGVENFKCATTLELATLCEIGAADVLVAYPVVGANAQRVREIDRSFDRTEVSALVESVEQIGAWRGSEIGLFVDVNPGMDRTGIEQDRAEEIVALVGTIVETGLTFRGLHYYDGHLADVDDAARERVAHSGYDRLLSLVDAIERAGNPVAEIITAGTPALPFSLSYGGFAACRPVHRVSPGTVIYGDCTSAAQLPSECGYRPAATVVATVVSHPTRGVVTCDAGHKTVSADAGVPTCAVLGRADLEPLHPSEEHLPIRVPAGAPVPDIGEFLYLVPRLVSPTINNFDHALLVENARITTIAPVTARGRETPL
jgi:D-serine deaminase-like pyridoxal phosphate-dependent protein